MPIFDDVRITMMDKGSLKGLVSVKMGLIKIDGMRVLDGKNGLFVSWPSRQLPTGEYKDICYPMTKETRSEAQEEILAVFYSQAG